MRPLNMLRQLREFLATWRSLPRYELASYPLMFASPPLLAHRSQPVDGALLWVLFLTILSLYAGFFSALIVNDLTDADVDAVAHPDRPLPSGRVSPRTFLAVSLTAVAVSFLAAAVISPWCAVLVVVTFSYAFVHDKYLKRRVPIPGYSELCGPIQWLTVGVFGFVAVWAAAPVEADLLISLPLLGSLSTSTGEVFTMLLLCAFIYTTDTWHDIPEGIADQEGDRLAGVTTVALGYGDRAATWISLGIFLLSGVVGVLLYLLTDRSLVFLLGFAALFLYVAPHPIRLVRMTDIARIRALAPEVGRRGYDYFLFAFNLLFVDLVLQRVLF